MAKQKTPKAKPNYVIVANGTTAELRLIGNISCWWNSSEEFTEQIDKLINAGVVNVNCYMNSCGGSMFEAPEIQNQIRRFTGHKELQLGAMCCSAATTVSMAFDKVVASPNTIYMIHNPTVNIDGDEDELLSAVQLLQVIKQQAITDYVVKTGLDADNIAKMMDATTWMSATKALELGFIDDIAGQPFTDEQDTEAELTDDIEMAVNNVIENGLWSKKQIVPINSTIKVEMNKPLIIAEMLKAGITVKNDASDVEVMNAITELATKKQDAERKLVEMETSIKTQKAKLIVDNAIDQKKALESEREVLMKDATDNPEMVERMLAKITPVQKASDAINPTGDPTMTDKSKWTFGDYFEKAPEDLAKMKAIEVEKYKKLYKDHYKMDCPNI